MWYRGKHRQSFTKKHSTDLTLSVGFLLLMAPVAALFMGGN